MPRILPFLEWNLLPRPKKNTQKSVASTIRIIGGQWRGRKLPVIDADGLRPTGDRIRETLFNWLAPYTAGARCLDLFAGTGALGLEAASRGAAEVQFAEYNTRAVQQLRHNLSSLNCDNAQVYAGDGVEWLRTKPPEPFDIIFLDPPFAENLWHPASIALSQGWLQTDALVYIECPKNQQLQLPLNWQQHKEKTAGAVRYGLFQITAEQP